MSYKEFADNERKSYNDMVQEVEEGPPSDRRVAGKKWRDAMLSEKQEIEDTIDHIYAGNYGPHPQLLIECIRDGSSRMKKLDKLGQLVAFLHLKCPPSEASKAWKSLNKSDRDSIEGHMLRALHKECDQDEDLYGD